MKKSTCIVYWMEDGQPKADVLQDDKIGEALKRCEALRKRAKDGELISHVCLSTEMVGNKTAPGVSDKLPAGYDWIKRREAYVPGRPSGDVGTELVLLGFEP